tara:strand:- start:538 stop:990 length:453 start_codon:yes stop_codon:yes gene_type:complete
MRDILESEEALGNWPVSTKITVQWGDLDALNHVNHTVFLTWMETARMTYFEQCGMLELMDSERVGPILAGLKADYKSPVKFPDTITVETTISRMGKTSFDMEYRILSEEQGGKLVSTGTVFGVMCDYKTGKSTKISDDLRSRIFGVESSV